VVDLPADKGGPDMVRWMPGKLEWLLVSRTDGKRGFIQRLPSATQERDALIAAVHQRLGSRWIGERLPLRPDLQKRFNISASGDGMRLALLIGSVLALLIVFLLLFGLLLLPAAFVLGGWAFRKGLIGLRDALHVANTPTAKVSSAAMGLVELEGRAVTDSPTHAGVSGAPCVWWDVSVEAWYSERGKSGSWKQVMARHGGQVDTLLIEDDTGRVPVWLRDADLLLRDHTWEKGKDALPPRGVALLTGTAFSWNGSGRLRVRERRMEVGSPVYVLGTLDEAHRLPKPGSEVGLKRLVRLVRTGEWRKALVHAMPGPLRAPMLVAISYVEMLTSIGHGGERARRLEDAAPPQLEPHAVVVWKGRSGGPLAIADQRESEALSQLRKRSLWFLGGGIVVLCWALYQFVDLF
jgi:hypothetical protein